MSDSTLKGARILIAEDDADTQFFITQVLGSAGANVVAVENGAQSVEMASTNAFDVIILDIDMPELDGLSAAEILRHRGVQIPILALSAHDLPGDVLNAHVAGFSSHFSKPIQKERLIEEITKLWKR